MNDLNDRPLRNWNTAMLIGTLGFVSAGLSAYVALSREDAGFDARQTALEKRVDALDTDVRYRLDKIDNKVDRLLEGSGK